MESQPQNPEFRNNPENLHPCIWLDTISLGWVIVHTKGSKARLSKFRYTCSSVFKDCFIR